MSTINIITINHITTTNTNTIRRFCGTELEFSRWVAGLEAAPEFIKWSRCSTVSCAPFGG